MLFLTYWEINEELSAKQNQEIATTILEEGLFPPEGAEIIRWDTTPDGWGIAVWEADDFEAVNEAIQLWRVAAGDTAFFEKTKTAPAAPVQEVLPQQAELLDRLE